MNTLSVRRKINLQFFTLAGLIIAVFAIIYGSINSLAQTNKNLQDSQYRLVSSQFGEKTGNNSAQPSPAGWITVSENEFEHIQKVSENKGTRFDLKIVEKRGGVSIIETQEEQMLDLSRNMHEEFHKCAGFMAHKSLEEARLSIERSLQADSKSQLVEYTIDNSTEVNLMLGEAQEPQIREVITRLSTDFPNRRYNQPSGLSSANWIKNRWTALAGGRGDISVEFFDHTTVGSPQPSVIMTIQGTTFPNEVVVLGGHQDSINRSGGGQTGSAPGADDDASGIASLTETIRVMIAKNFRPKRTVKFMAYAAEEIGLVGSQQIAADFKTRGVNVVGVLQLDMTNYQSPGATVDIAMTTDLTNASQNEFVRNLIRTYLPTLTIGNDTCGYGCSDHASWNNQGFAASFPFEGINSNPTIHTPNDTLAQSAGNANHALKFTKIAVAYVGELAKGATNITTAATATISGRVLSGRRGVARASVTLTDATGEVRTTTTNPLGFYQFTNVATGGSYIFEVRGKRYKFAPKAVNVTEDITDLNFNSF